jgi:hypothetical protein
VEREYIYEQLREQIPYISRHECTARVMSITDSLLDLLLEIQKEEAYELLLGEEGSYGLKD